MKYLITAFFVILFIDLKSQTYIGPVLGYDWSKIVSNYKENQGIIYETVNVGYVTKSPFFGIKLEQYFSSRLYFFYQLKYMQKSVKAITPGLLPVESFRFNYLFNDFSIKYLISNNFYFGLGLNINKLSDLDLVFIYNDNDQHYIQYEKGLHVSSGIKYKNFDLEFYFFKSLTPINKGVFLYFYLDPINSYGFNLSYSFKIFNKLDLFKRKSNCPTF